MTLYATWPFFAVLAGILLLLHIDPIFKRVDRPAAHARDRYSNIDGLRGFLAFSVFGHHALVTHEYLLTGIWNVPPSGFYALLGEVGVALFFAITGFLFWGKLLSVHGEIDWKKLYIGRFFRIAPVYLSVVAALLLVVFARTNFELHESLYFVGRQVARWLFLGILGQPDVNGYEHTGLLLAGVTWTLRYEWLYYFSLPLLAVFARRSAHLLFASAGLVACLVVYGLQPNLPLLFASLFFCGMAAASLLHDGFRINADGKFGLAVAMLCLSMLFLNFSTAFGIVQIVLLGVVFYVVSSNRFLGILRLKCSRRLGEISYSVYLIHGLVLTGIFSIGAVREFALTSSGRYWLIVALCALSVILTASGSYCLIERPGIGAGKKAAALV